MVMQRRTAARVLLLDEQDRLLLLRGIDPAKPDVTWWITPGGGLEPGEGVPEAALRELFEETGLRDVVLGPLVAFGTVSFSFRGQRFEQDQWFHLARTARSVVDPPHSGDQEHALLLESRWWTAAELRDTVETVYPVGLAGFLERLLADGPPVTPVRL
ncbi:NUDIX hydrolase [Kitasatospora sp. NPDC057015]|uniref:NUDIX hydrolase n=1 Tax=Kitasatospora sp. NPDC057015 TaxID=3346001 RepID=UPI0036255FAD